MQKALPIGSLSNRNILLFVASLVATVFATLLLAISPVSAAPDADITWQEGTILYDGTTYRGPTLSNDRSGYELPNNTILYLNVDDANQQRVIYFPANSDPAEADTATFVTYKRNSSGMLSDKSSPQTLTIDATSATEANTGEAGEGASSCKVSGIGYIICPITTFFAEGMDWVFGILKQFVEVTPLATESDSTMRRAWEVMRSFANVAFVIAFLIIIYSQLTSVGMSNYGIKKLLPRIVIAAILVNVSYWICVIAIDVSNILGNSLQGVFMGLRDMVGINNDAPINWSDLTLFILSGGALGTIAAISFVTGAGAIGSIGGLLFLLLPILVGAATTVLFVVFILAARQALITILVIIAPLAFVAYLLPNTEKWFEKWRSLFITMMVFFPAFSVVFGGSQFAGAMIISSAGANLVLIILGMAVQIAPLAITPLLLKLSGTLLSRIGGLVNNPTRGIKDRTRNWSKDRGEAYRANQMRKTREMARKGNLKGRHFVRRSALNSDNMRRVREARKGANEMQSDALFNQTESGYAIHKLQHAANVQKEQVETELKTKIQAEINTAGTTLNAANLKLEADKLVLENTETKTKETIVAEKNRENSELYNAHVAGESEKAMLERQESINKRMSTEFQTQKYYDLLEKRGDVSEQTKRNLASIIMSRHDTMMESTATQRAKERQEGEYAELVKSSKGLRARAAGTMGGDREAMLALADATKTASGHYSQGIENSTAIINAGNYSDEQVRLMAEGQPEVAGLKITEEMQIAAIRKTAGGKNAGEIVNLMKNLNNINELSSDVRQELGDALLSNSAKPAWISAGTIGKIKEGTMDLNGDDRFDQWILSTIEDGGFSGAETFLNQDKAFIGEVFKSLQRTNNAGGIQASPLVQQLTAGMSNADKATYTSNIEKELNELASQIHMVNHDNRFKGRIQKRDKNLGKLYDELAGTDGVHTEQSTYKAAQEHKPEPTE